MRLPFLASLLVLASCSQSQQDSITLDGAYDSRRIMIEIADDPQEHSKGLMDRAALAPNSGMLFIFPNEIIRTFWMHNTHFPLDILFIDSTGKIVGIVHSAKPDRDDPLSVGRPSTYVLEIEAGLSNRLGIKEGTVLKIASISS